MEDRKQTSFTFEIDNFWDKEALIRSPNFFSGGCEWFVDVYPRGCGIEDHLSTFLCVANPESLLLGWKRRAILSLVLLNVSGKRLYRLYRDGPPCKTFCAQIPAWGWADAMPLEMLQENGFTEKNKLIVQVNVQVVEVVDEAEVTGKETLDVNGFQVLYSEVGQVTAMFAKHPDVALNFIPKSQLVKTVYMKLLMFLIEKLNKPPRSFSNNALSNARMELIDLTKAGFKLDWLKEKLDEISLERKKENGDGSLSSYGFRVQELEEQVQELEEQVKNLNLELDTEKVKSAKVLSLEQTKNKLILKAVVKVIEVVDEGDTTANETLDVCGFQAVQVTRIFKEHPDIALNFIPTSQPVKTTYMNLILGLIDKLDKPPRSFTSTELSIAGKELIDIKSWLQSKLVKDKAFEVSLEWKKENIDNYRIKNLNLDLETEKLKSAAKVLSLEQTVSELRDELS
ncbi:unnamed protein product [Brassica rapa]|uniref:MATH domain-containing protein n=2 Tax=Brassica TaxID=3705 RepID=A0A8D9GXM3_BRACM|nr:unnamed protein product [Brassica napus]CAG7889023.1 unnamed protein product [Brassica rapa]